MQIDWFTFIAQLVNFLILLALLRYFLYGPILRVMQKRETFVSSKLEEASIKMSEAEKQAGIYDKKLSELEHKKGELLDSARKEAVLKKKELVQEARNEVDIMQKRWEAAMKSEKDEFFNELYRRTSTKVIDIVDKIINGLSGKELEEVTIEKFSQKLSQIDNSEMKSAVNAALQNGEGEFRVVSSFAMTEAQKEKLLKIIHEAFGIQLNCVFATDEELRLGIEIRVPGWKIGWNAKAYLDDIHDTMEDLFHFQNEDSNPLKNPG